MENRRVDKGVHEAMIEGCVVCQQNAMYQLSKEDLSHGE